MVEEDFEDVIGKWLEDLTRLKFPLRFRHRYRVKGDSGNYRDIDFVGEGTVAPPKNWKELLNTLEDAFNRMVESKDAYEKSKKELDDLMLYGKSFNNVENAYNRFINAFKYDPKILIEVKSPGWAGEKPTEQTYREHMLRAYAYLGDYRNQDNQKYVIVPYKLVKSGGFNYDSYFRSIGALLLDYNNPKDRSILEDRIRSLSEELARSVAPFGKIALKR